MVTPAVHELHAALSDALERHIEPILTRSALHPERWRISLICRDITPGAEGIWVNVTNDDPAAVARLLTQPPGEIVR